MTKRWLNMWDMTQQEIDAYERYEREHDAVPSEWEEFGFVLPTYDWQTGHEFEEGEMCPVPHMIVSRWIREHNTVIHQDNGITSVYYKGELLHYHEMLERAEQEYLGLPPVSERHPMILSLD